MSIVLLLRAYCFILLRKNQSIYYHLCRSCVLLNIVVQFSRETRSFSKLRQTFRIFKTAVFLSNDTLHAFILSTGATLIFDVELLNVGDQAPTTNVFKEIDQDQDKQLSRDEVSEYLKKQMAAAEGAEGSDDIKQMMSDHEKLVEEIFQHEDKDKNGFISHDEFTGPKHDEL
uniref:peptidylprolyl isomerase n=1 Tax=Sipha flava TaxID=143950 RepID=A0A2S2RAL2_9HEMI